MPVHYPVGYHALPGDPAADAAAAVRLRGGAGHLGMIRDLFVMIVVPAALAMVLCRLLGQSICAKAKQRLSPFSKLALLVIICANVTRCAPFLHELNRELVLLLCITLAMRLIGLGLGFLLSTLFRFPIR